MSNEMSVIHKQVIKLTTAMFLEKQAFEVPLDAEMVEIYWDTREMDGIAFWYKTAEPVEGETNKRVKIWNFYIRGTGYPFPDECVHQATVVRDGFAWHILDADGSNIEWAEL